TPGPIPETRGHRMSRPLHRLLSVAALISLIVGGTPALAHDDDVRIHGVAVGTPKLQGLARGGRGAHSGRGDQIRARWPLDAHGVPASYDAEGNDYWKVPLTEHFDVTAGQARWKNRI